MSETAPPPSDSDFLVPADALTSALAEVPKRAKGQRRPPARTVGQGERTLPHDIEAERAFLGAMFLDESIARRAVDHLSTRDFFRQAHSVIFAAACLVLEEGMAPDLITVKNQLHAEGRLESVGGMAYLSSLTDGLPKSINWPHYASIVRELRKHRDVIAAGQKVVEEAYDTTFDSEVVIDRADVAFQKLRTEDTDDDIVGQDQAVPEFLAFIEYRVAHRGELIGLSTSLPTLDTASFGICPSELVVVAADTGGGKSALALQLARGVVKQRAEAALYFSLEMPRRDMEMRIAAAEAHVMMFKIREGWLSPGDLRAINASMADAARWPLFIEERQMTVGQIRAASRRLAAERPLGLIVVDYLQLITPDERFTENRTVQVGAMSRGLKLLAQELKIPIVALSQMSRKGKQEKRRPELYDLRESGSIEQDADSVWFLYQEKDVEDPNEPVPMELIVRKQRNGPSPVTVPILFDKPHMTVLDVEAEKKALAKYAQTEFDI